MPMSRHAKLHAAQALDDALALTDADGGDGTTPPHRHDADTAIDVNAIQRRAATRTARSSSGHRRCRKSWRAAARRSYRTSRTRRGSRNARSSVVAPSSDTPRRATLRRRRCGVGVAMVGTSASVAGGFSPEGSAELVESHLATHPEQGVQNDPIHSRVASNDAAPALALLRTWS